MFMSFDMKFIRRDQKMRRNGEARAEPFHIFWSSLINVISKDDFMIFYLSCYNSLLYNLRNLR